MNNVIELKDYKAVSIKTSLPDLTNVSLSTVVSLAMDEENLEHCVLIGVDFNGDMMVYSEQLSPDDIIDFLSDILDGLG